MSIDTRNSERKIEAMTATPKPWMDLMNQQGITSIRQLAKVAGLPDHSAINRVIMKGTSTSEENMIRVARALKVPVEELYRITSGVAARPLTMPAGTEKLSERQKNAVAEIIRTMIEEKEYVEKFVDKKTDQTAERVQEKTASVTPIGGRVGRVKLTPAERKFEDTGRKVARNKRDVPQDTPKDSQDTRKGPEGLKPTDG